MRNRLAVLVGLCVACVLSFDANAALWRLEGDALVRRAGAMRTEASLPGSTVKVSARSDGGAWLTSGDSLWSIDHDGQAGPHIDLVNRGFGIATHVAADPYDGSVWIATDAPLLLHIALDGRVEHGTTLAAPAASLVIDLAQGAWLIARDELLHFDRNGAPLEARPLELPIDEAVTALAVDSLHERLWFGSSIGLHYVDARGSGLPPVRVLRGDATALAVDQRRGITLAIVDGGLVAFDGLIRRQGSDAIPAIDAPVLAVDYDAEDDAFIIDTAAETIRMEGDGRVQRNAPASGNLRAATPLRIDPVLALLRPPAGAALTDAHAEIVMLVGATCNGVRCDVPTAYLENMRLVAALDGATLGDARITADGRATFPNRARMTEGSNTVTAAAIDGFGHTETLERAQWTLLPARNLPNGGLATAENADRNVFAKAGNKPPTVSLTSPVSGARFTAGTTIGLTATAADADGSIAKVEFYRDGGTLIGTASTAPYQTAWGSAAAGTYVLTAKAYDNRKATATSTPATIVVVNNLPPAVALTSPAPGTVTNPGSVVSLTASANDPDGSIAQVEFFDGVASIAMVTSPPYQVTWNASAPGHHALSAQATDDAGAVTRSSSVDVVVAAAPVVVVTSPVSCSTVDGPVEIILGADAKSTTGAIASVEFFDNAVPVGVATSAPWRVVLTNASVGTHSITAKATDDHGMTSTSRAATVTVRGANQPPVVAITAPNEDTHFPFGASVVLAATASDADGTVTAVEFRSGSASGTLLARVTGAPYAATWASPPVGTYTIVAVAYDDRNAKTTSAPLHVIVDANVPPSVAITAPSANTKFVAPANITVTAAASDSDGSIARVEFFSGSTSIGTATTSPYGVTWSGVGAGNYTITAKATDNAGSTATSTPVAITVTSNVPPTVELTAPTAGSQFFAPATVSLTADAQDSDGSIASVDFYANGTLVGHATSAPYRTIWDGAGAGTYALSAKATDDLGGVTTSNSVNVIIAPPSINIDSSLQGATIDDDNVLVRGFIDAPANSSVTINGVVTHLDDFRGFQANGVPLVPGDNAIQVVVTTQDGQSASQTITLKSSGPGAFVVDASPTEGLESLKVTITIENPRNTPFKQINLDLESDGFPNLVVTPDQFFDGKATITATYPVGTWTALIKAYDSDDNLIYSTAKSIVVRMPEVLQANLLGVYEGMLTRLRAGNIPGALTAFTGSAYDRYNAIFTQLQPSLPQLLDKLGEVQEISFVADMAEMIVVRDTPDGAASFMVYLIRCEDGIWRIDGM